MAGPESPLTRPGTDQRACVTDSGPSRVTFLNRLLGSADGWADGRSMLADLCTAYGARSAGLRWPADGTPLLVAETAPAPKGAAQLAVTIARLPAGLLWIDGPRA